MYDMTNRMLSEGQSYISKEIIMPTRSSNSLKSGRLEISNGDMLSEQSVKLNFKKQIRYLPIHAFMHNFISNKSPVRFPSNNERFDTITFSTSMISKETSKDLVTPDGYIQPLDELPFKNFELIDGELRIIYRRCDEAVFMEGSLVAYPKYDVFVRNSLHSKKYDDTTAYKLGYIKKPDGLVYYIMPINEGNAIRPEEIANAGAVFLSSFFYIQTMALNYPERFVESKPQTQKGDKDDSNVNKKRSKHEDPSKVRVLKIVSQEEAAKIRKDAKHEYSCERWNVRGHWRSYKSGKKVWINSYEKGKKRNTDAVLGDKEYELVKNS